MPRTPHSTYRLQLHKHFTFQDASAIAKYIADLGVSHVYCSPYLQAAPGSMHGYDVVDHQAVNEELGGAEGHRAFSTRLHELHLGQVLDTVPNHMSVAKENRLWWDVLENGPASRYSSFFDIDWDPSELKLRDKILLPVLSDQYGRELSAGKIKVLRQGSTFLIQYYDKTFPVAPRSLSQILGKAADLSRSDTLSFLSESFARLPAPDSTDRSVQHARHRDKTVLRSLLDRLCDEERATCETVDAAIEDLNSNVDALDEFLNAQNFRLAYHRTADQELGYRRFFDVNSLVGLRVEREHVFDETHALILQWLDEGLLDGVRVDHPDGLRDPAQYFERLRKRAPEAWIVGEKILEPGEYLRESWPIQGTSGYDFLNLCNGLIVNPDGLDELQTIYTDFAEAPGNFEEIVYDKKTTITKETLASDVNRLAALFVTICENNRNSRDYTRAEIRRMIRAVASCFPIYRTYVVAEREEMMDEDRDRISKAVNEARHRKPEIDGGLFEFMADVLSLRVRGRVETEFVMRFQQFTSPVMAKGVEDTAFYCYNRLTSLNEVGGDPSRHGVSLQEFHEYQQKMQTTHPVTMLTLSTHDTKRAADVRARIAVISEIAPRFRATLHRCARINQSLKTGSCPDRNTEYFYYQTLIGAWPLSIERAQEYMLKAAREAKLETSWTANNRTFEDALLRFIESSLQHEPFLQEVSAFVERVNRSGRINSLSQTLLMYTCPGVPDLYQGSELWDHSLVDPDNRRPVDYDLRRQMLDEIRSISPPDAIAQMEDRFESGFPKLWLIHHALQVRRDLPSSFGAEATYTPVLADGPRANHVIAFLRGDNVLALAQRLPHKLAGSWAGTIINIPEGRWINRFTGATVRPGRIKVQALLEQFPVALLTREE